jgi:CubicO group peptidase (beta-lactamase class C family)
MYTFVNKPLFMTVKILMSKSSRMAIWFIVVHFFAIGAYGQQKSKAQLIDQYIKKKLANTNLPGLAIAVVHYDTVLIAKGYGKATDKSAITANTPFAIASLSKAFTAMAILQLAGQGKINLDAPVVKYIPTFLLNEPRRKTVTVRQLLHQVSGMADKGYPEFTFKDQPDSLDGAIDKMKLAKLTAAPGKKFQYHNPNYQVLAKIVETVSGDRFANYLQHYIFTPLKMTGTRDLANTKQFVGQGLQNGNIYFLGKPIVYNEPDWFVDGAAGIISNANDMAKWLSAQVKPYHGDSTAVLSNKYLRMMQNPPAGSAFSYGMGWFNNSSTHTLYHSGILWTYSSQQLIMTDTGYGITVMFNGGANIATDYYSFLQGIQDIINNKPADVSAIPIGFYSWGIICLATLIAIFGTRRLLRIRQWHQNYRSRPKWRSWVYMLMRLLFLVVLLTVPTIVAAITGRVLSWERIILMFPDVVLILALAALLNMLIVIKRLIYLQSTTANQLHRLPLG